MNPYCPWGLVLGTMGRLASGSSSVGFTVIKHGGFERLLLETLCAFAAARKGRASLFS